MQLVKSYQISLDFNITSQRVSCPGSTGQTARRTVLAERDVPSGCRIEIAIFSAKVVDLANSDQIFFALERNGQAIMPGYERIPGVQFDFQSQIAINGELAPGTIQLVAYNISGANTAIEPDALPVATDVRCQAWMSGNLKSLTERRVA